MARQRRLPRGLSRRRDGSIRLQVSKGPGLGFHDRIFDNEADALDTLATLRATPKGRFPTASGNPYLSDYLRDWNGRRRGVASSTTQTYDRLIDSYIRGGWRLGGMRLRAIGYDDLDEHFAKLDASGIGRASIHMTRRMLAKALGDAARDGLIDSNPVPLSTPPVYRKPRPMPPTVGQLARILAALEGDRLEMLYRLIAATGLRHGEALGLRWQDLTLTGEAPEMRITGKLDLHARGPDRGRDDYPKTTASAAALPLDRELVEIFEAQAKRQAGERERAGDRWTDSGLVFSSSIGTPMDPDNVRRRIRDAAKRTGVAQERRDAGLRPLRIHDLRHAFAQHAIDADPSQFVGVSKYLRHASIRVTADLYTAPSRELLAGVRRTVTRHRKANGAGHKPGNKGQNKGPSGKVPVFELGIA